MATVPSTQKILTSSEAVNTTYGGSQALKELNTWYTMEDISNTVKPYKVFTALLTQSGGDAPTGVGSGNIIEGVRYSFVEYEVEGWDFTNVGGPKYPAANSFTATVTATPILWGGVTLEYNAGAPVATVLENTIGNIWFTYDSIGFYSIKSNSLFTDKKTTFLFGVVDNNPGSAAAVSTDHFVNNIDNYSFNTSNISGSSDNGFLYNTPIEIRVYN